MGAELIPEQLLEARQGIDQVDNDLVALLAQRFALTHKVGELKASNKLNAVDPDRERRKLAQLQSLCDQNGLNPELVNSIFTLIMAEAVKNHRLLQS
ncbi:MAG: chorismate mutase [SAR86 cluster bacterium]|uniref:chorismate mutase n=1 Tax=SAR86 cluster bacterium TaxID=2030880 RepID=A0A2A4MH01_9GAMM|nr:MAG: chorismate mutase [SAR86 cluster bacterium]